jgi:hypothetical protein
MWFKKLTNYPRQVLHPKQLALIEHVDNELVKAHNGKIIARPNTEMNVCVLPIPFHKTILPLNFIINDIELETGESYIPRTVAFLTDANGNWYVLYGIYSTDSTNDLLSLLFIDALTRTNNARSKGE